MQRLNETATQTDPELSLAETIDLALARHPGRLVVLCSFQKEESVLIDALLERAGRIGKPLGELVRVVTIDTGVLFPETIATWLEFEQRFGLHVEVEYATPATIGEEGSWTGPERCCSPAKVAALERALVGAEGWVTGLRREQSETRAHILPAERDEARGLWKYNPLCFWSERELWRRIHARSLPYHPLHDRGYGSIGCATCTAPGVGREGRWAGTEKTECGLHLPPDRLPRDRTPAEC